MLLSPQLLIRLSSAPPAAGGSASLTFTAGPVAQNGGTSHTYSAQSIGAASASRIIIVAVTAAFGAATALSVTINGSAATIAITENSDAGHYVGIAYLAVPTGTTANIVITTSGGNLNASQIAVYSAIGYTTNPAGGATVGTTAWAPVVPGPMVDTATIPTGGFAIGVFQTDRSTAATFSTGTLDFHQNDATTGDDIYAVSLIANGSQTLTSSSITTTYQAAMACWGP